MGVSRMRHAQQSCRKGSSLVVVLEHQSHASHEERAEDGHAQAGHRPCRCIHLLGTGSLYCRLSLASSDVDLPIGPHMMADVRSLRASSPHEECSAGSQP